MKNLKIELENLEIENDKIIAALNRLAPNRQYDVRQRHHNNLQRMNEIRNLIDIYDN